MMACSHETGTINGYGESKIETFGEQRRASEFINAYLRKTGKSVSEYGSTEEVLNDFLSFLEHLEVGGSRLMAKKELVDCRFCGHKDMEKSPLINKIVNNTQWGKLTVIVDSEHLCTSCLEKIFKRVSEVFK